MVTDSETNLISKRKKAIQIVESNRIKFHRFLPSGRELWTAVGSDGDHLINNSQPYCSCRDFHFRLITDKDTECYHLLALHMAIESKKYYSLDFQDEEYYSFIKGLLEDLSNKR